MARGPSTWQKCWSHAQTVSMIWGHNMIICLCQPRKVWHMVTVHLVFWDLICGTICPKRSCVVVACHPARLHLKHICSNSRIISSRYFPVTLNCVMCGCILGELFLISRKSVYMCTTYYPRILFLLLFSCYEPLICWALWGVIDQDLRIMELALAHYIYYYYSRRYVLLMFHFRDPLFSCSLSQFYGSSYILIYPLWKKTPLEKPWSGWKFICTKLDTIQLKSQNKDYLEGNENTRSTERPWCLRIVIVTLCYVILCYVTLRYVTLCYVYLPWYTMVFLPWHTMVLHSAHHTEWCWFCWHLHQPNTGQNNCQIY